MQKRLPGLLLSFIIGAYCILFVHEQAAFATQGQKDAEQVKLAKEFVSQLSKGKFELSVARFDKVMSKALPADKLKTIWGGIVRQYGPLQRSSETRVEIVNQYHLVFVTCEFERGKLDAKVVFSADNKITGLFFVPTESYRTPSYVDASLFEEEEVTFGKGIWLLPGTLTLPKGKGPFPAVVLVHGSGPNDRDETIGPNKPFRDLAQGLASQGIAVLRYEKRTKHHRLKMALLMGNMTVKEETIDDAVAAVDFLVKHERIDSRRVFVLGHSLGGNLIPQIGTETDRIAGFISLAGSVRPLEDLVLDQTRYLFSYDGKITEEEQLKIDEITRQVKKVKSPELSPETDAKELPLGIPAKYWLDLRGYNPAVSAKALKAPLLILQGERDYQVTMDDFSKWKNALETCSNVKFISYPKLNHLFMEGEEKSSPAEYTVPGNVAKAVINDIAHWVKTQK
ncbi:alpha/beta fold hydrolase [Gimesia aquarii]|uniref:Alpha/beta hydrolase family protein n=1 Tax=Gimesia aquarii TaxID=2527964 RepID=A0A517W115_9PLAN|nr:alpha/beta fold hydrolase [Gimesia aquarii]QDT98940.1 Alpha/beta hydrolase family protein [Gimesia aquarii]